MFRFTIRELVLIGLFFVAGCGEQAPVQDASTSAVSDPQLSRDLKSATDGSVSDRCSALKRIGEYWSPRRVVRGGFTDLPDESPQPAAKPISMADIEAIAKVLQAAIADSHHEVREAAAICLCNAPRPSPAVNSAIAVALKSEDNSVLWYLSQLDSESFQLPEPGPYVANLIEHLKSGEFSSQHAAADLIGRLGKQFIPYSGAVVDALPEIKEDDKWLPLLTLADTGISEDAANRLPHCVENSTAETQAAAFVALLSLPSNATRFLRDHPGLGPALSQYDSRWCEVLYSTAPNQQELRSALISTPGLGPLNLALIGSPDSIPELARELASTDKYRQTLLRACIRACEGDLGEIVHLSQQVPVAFKPTSAWPNVDPRRKSDVLGHGDGFTDILITGELRFADGGHPDKVQFLRTNDSMLLGERHHLPMPLKYDAMTGRFVLRTSVFAAYDTGKPPEPGPYQTGSAQVRIESPKSAPLVVQFFDEMPHVVIELTRQ